MFDTFERLLITDKELLSKLAVIYEDFPEDLVKEYEFDGFATMSYIFRLVVEVDGKFYGTYTDDDLEGNMSDFEDLEWVEVKPVPVEIVSWQNIE